MKKKKFFIIMAVMILTVALLVVGCSTEDNDEDTIVDQDDNIIGEEDQVSEETEEDEDLTESDEKDYFDEEDIEVKNQYDIEVGKLSPNFTLENLEGEEVSLEDYKGKIIMLNFWATWCPYCVKEMPDMNRLQEENDDLVVLAVNIKEEKDKVKEYIEEGGYDFEVVLDTKASVAETYLVGPLPTTYFIDKEGILIGGVPGMLEYPQMKQLIEGIRDNQ